MEQSFRASKTFNVTSETKCIFKDQDSYREEFELDNYCDEPMNTI